MSCCCLKEEPPSQLVNNLSIFIFVMCRVAWGNKAIRGGIKSGTGLNSKEKIFIILITFTCVLCILYSVYYPWFNDYCLHEIQRFTFTECILQQYHLFLYSTSPRNNSLAAPFFPMSRLWPPSGKSHSQPVQPVQPETAIPHWRLYILHQPQMVSKN